MLERIRRYFIRKEWIKPKGRYEKIFYILNSNIDLRKLYQIQESFVLSDIDKYIEEFSSILKQDIFQPGLKITKVSNNHICNKKFYYFLAVDGKIPYDSQNKLKRLCSLFRDLSYLVDLNLPVAEKQGAKGSLAYNLNLLRLHILYIDNIIESIYSCCQLEHKTIE